MPTVFCSQRRTRQTFLLCLALTLANTIPPLLADPPVIHANTLVLHPDRRITFQFQADPGDTRVFQVERTAVLQAGGTWQAEPSA